MSELQQLRDRVEVLEYVVGIKMPEPYDMAMRKLLGAGQYRTCAPVQMLGILLKREAMTVDGMSLAIPGSDGEPTSRECLKVHMHRIRRALAPYGIRIDSLDRQGWFISKANKLRLHAVIAGIAAEACA